MLPLKRKDSLNGFSTITAVKGSANIGNADIIIEPPNITLHYLRVTNQYRGQGVGSLLLNEVKRVAE